MTYVPGGSGSLPDGVYRFQAIAKDAAGNQTITTVPFRISEDTEKPVLSINTPKANQHFQASAVEAYTVSGKATDNVAVSTVFVKLYRTVGGVKEFWNGSAFTGASVSLQASVTGGDLTNRSWNLAIIADASLFIPGTYNVRVGATDSAGNVATLQTRTFIIDLAPASGLRMKTSVRNF